MIGKDRYPDELVRSHLRAFLLNPHTEGVVAEEWTHVRDADLQWTLQGWRVKADKAVNGLLSALARRPEVRHYLDNHLPLTLEIRLGARGYNYTNYLDAGRPNIEQNWKPNNKIATNNKADSTR